MTLVLLRKCVNSVDILFMASPNSYGECNKQPQASYDEYNKQPQARPWVGNPTLDFYYIQ